MNIPAHLLTPEFLQEERERQQRWLETDLFILQVMLDIRALPVTFTGDTR